MLFSFQLTCFFVNDITISKLEICLRKPFGSETYASLKYATRLQLFSVFCFLLCISTIISGQIAVADKS